jgi:hypothetical protein
MGLVLTGIARSVRNQTVRPKPGDSWEPFESLQVVVVDYGSTHYVEVVGDELKNNLPAEGDEVAIDVSINMYVGKTGQPGYRLKGWRLAAAPGVRAVKAAG